MSTAARRAPGSVYRWRSTTVAAHTKRSATARRWRSGARVLRARLVAVLIECIVPISQEDVAVILEVRDDQIVLRCEVPIKVYLRDTSLFDNLLYADGVDTLAIE